MQYKDKVFKLNLINFIHMLPEIHVEKIYIYHCVTSSLVGKR